MENELSVYLTDTDPLIQELSGLSYDEYLNRIKTWLLLADKVIISGSHVLSSPISSRFLAENPIVLQRSAVTPYLREGCASFLEYSDLIYRDERKDINKSDSEQIARLIDENLSKPIIFKANAARADYKEGILTAMIDINSEVRQGLGEKSNGKVDSFCEAVERMPIITREKVQDAGHLFFPEKADVIEDYSNLLYYVLGAANLGADPVLQKDLFAFASAKTMVSPPNDTRILQYSEPTIIDKLVYLNGLIENILAQLDMKEIINIRESSEGISFRKKCNRLFGRSLKQGNLDDIVKTSDQFFASLASEFKKERIRAERWRKSIDIANYVGYFTSFVSGTAITPILGIASLILSTLLLPGISDAIYRKFSKTEMLLFAQTLQQSYLQSSNQAKL